MHCVVPSFNELNAPTNGTFPSFLEIKKTVIEYSLQIDDYLSQIQRETKAFRLIDTTLKDHQYLTGSDWLFFFVGSQNRVNLVLFFKP